MSDQNGGFKSGIGDELPQWVQWCICITILGTIAYFALHTPELKPVGKMKTIAESILHGDVPSKSRAIWELQYAKPGEAASLLPVLLEKIDEETGADPAIARDYHERNMKLAGPFAAFYTPRTITIGDLAAYSIGRIRQNLIIETSGDGGPTAALVAVRKAISKKAAPMLCSGVATGLKIRILRDILLGDTDPSPIKTVVSCCLNDDSAEVRAYSASLFLTYSKVDRRKTLAAVPALIDLIDDPDIRVSHVAQTVLRVFSGRDFGSNADLWKEWFACSNKKGLPLVVVW